MTKQNRHVIVDKDANRMCNLSGLTKAKGHVDRLRKEQLALDVALKDAEAERDRYRRSAKQLLALKVIKSTCDGFINLAAEFAEYIPGVREGARKVKTGYDMLTPAANTLGTVASGGEPDYAKDGLGVVKGATGLIKNDAIASGAQMKLAQADMIANMNSDKKELRHSIEEQGLIVSKLISVGHKGANNLDKNVKTRFDRFNTVVSIAKITNDYNTALGESVDEFFNLTKWSDAEYASKQGEFSFKSKRIQDHLNEAMKYISDCEAELAERQPARPAQPAVGQALSGL